MNSRCESFVLVLLAGMWCAGCGGDKVGTVAAGPPNGTTPAITASAPPTTKDVLTVSGPLIVEHQVDVTTQRDGIVATIFVDAGRRARSGTLLAALDGRQLTANLEAARAKSRSIQADLKNWESEAEVLKADYGRAQRLWDLCLNSEGQVQHAKYKAQSDQWDI